ncbi:MAG TPA: YqiA/YcfP family alpha/beta fold hydrolase [Burkholderiales bacterium]|nr:YqiA/YcfP family alpha/beta fold hydrolase [Burkholderiales bacterium]
MKLLYIHGFNSSSASVKARVLREELARLNRGNDFLAPDLPHMPSLAMQELEREIAQHSGHELALIGSSLGGHYATWLAEKYDFPAVLVNPAVNPHLLLVPCLGAQINVYTGEQYWFTQQHLGELEQYNLRAITRPGRYLLLVQTGDELLDYRQAIAKYRGARQIVIEGGDHGFQNFSDYVSTILGFVAEKLPQAGMKHPA